jgi:5-methyltetrahydrofolate--homocysteine methyltransferase
MDNLRRQQLDGALASRILILDGAMGTMLQARKPTAADYGGPGLEGCNEHLCRTRPEWVLDVHGGYLDAGADIIETNSFQGSSIVLAEYGLAAETHDLNLTAARLARQAADAYSTPANPRFVAGAMGPTTKSITLRADVTFRQLSDSYYEQARALVEGGVDLLLMETAIDTGNVKAGLIAIQKLERDRGERIPVIISATIERWGTMLAGQSVDAFYASVSHADLLAIGLNCATGPDLMADPMRTLAQMATTRVSCHPNAGLPDQEGRYLETPDLFARHLERFVEQGWLNIVGGCCGTTPAHIRALAQMADGRPPRVVHPTAHRSYYSGLELVEAEESTRPLIVGERTNATGSRLFKQMIAEEKWEEASDIARRQVKNGAQIVDVCLQSSDRDELQDIDPFYAKLMPAMRAPIMIETTDPIALEQALTWCQGKSVINSISLEDGEEQFERVCPIARTYGAALVVGAIDENKEQAQAVTRERKLAIAERSVRLLTGKYGFRPEDIIVDPLVFPCGSGDEHYIGGAVEAIEAVRLVKERIPFVKTLLGVSAVSFGLPDAARPVVNSVFLYHATKAGLDLAIVNAEKIQRFASISREERGLAERLLFNTPPADADDPLVRTAPDDWRLQTRDQKVAIAQFHLTALTEHFRRARPNKPARAADRPLDERLVRYIVEGTRDGLIADLDRKLSQGANALDIINGPLMTGMAEVGRLFNENELIVAEVLQSAEAMNAAVSYLEEFIDSTDVSAVSRNARARGTVLLATVKGDVHDIGKNLVEIVLANNGYRVIDLGIRVSPEVLIAASREHQPDAIGLSGLLVKSAHQMVATAADLRDHGVDVPLLVGGAALSDAFTRTRIGPAYGAPTFYAKDAMTGLAIMNELADPATRDALLARHVFSGERASAIAEKRSPRPALDAETDRGAKPDPYTSRSSRVNLDCPLPEVSDLQRHFGEIPNRREVWSYINPFMLFNRHLGFTGNFEARLAERDPRALELRALIDEAEREADSFMKVRAVWQFFEAERAGNSINLFLAGERDPVHAFHFRRQPTPDGLCLSDYVLDARQGRRDHVGVFVVTAGECVRQHAEEAKARGAFLLSHALQALALETAEACAEWLHRRMREDWGFPDTPTRTMQERFTSRYRGKRYSFGYPACPDLEDQLGIWKLLKPEEIGVQLTEGFMMDPEASVSALVFHHPDCEYFAVESPSG